MNDLEHYDSATDQGDAAMEMLGLLMITAVVLILVVVGILVVILVDMPSIGLVEWIAR